MYTTDFPEPEKATSWDELQRGISADAGLEEVPGFTKEASSSSGREILLSSEDSLYANTGLLNEALEIDRHVERMSEEKLAYVVIEKSLVQMGYQRPNIRRSFHRITGIDPIHAYLDAANYPVPPGSVPRYNYGWGEAKEGSADYLFVLPWTDKYAVFKLTGMEREIVSEHHLLEDAREDLKKKVKALRDVTPDTADTLTDIFQKVASVGGFSARGAAAYEKIRALCGMDPNVASQALVQMHDDGAVTDAEFRTIAEAIVLAAPVADPTLTAPERIDEREFQSFRDNQEGRSFKEMKQNTMMPGQEFASSWQDSHKVDFWGVLIESRELFTKIVSTIQGFRIEPEWGSFHVMPQPSLAVDDDNHILDGSVAVGASVETSDANKESQIAILMFIHNGKLRYAGKFKGANEREYALTSQGLEEYFEDLEGSTAIDENIGMGGSSDSMGGGQSEQRARL